MLAGSRVTVNYDKKITFRLVHPAVNSNFGFHLVPDVAPLK